jgi:hypothetical protein
MSREGVGEFIFACQANQFVADRTGSRKGVFGAGNCSEVRSPKSSGWRRTVNFCRRLFGWTPAKSVGGASRIQVSCFPGETFTLPNGAMPTIFCLIFACQANPFVADRTGFWKGVFGTGNCSEVRSPKFSGWRRTVIFCRRLLGWTPAKSVGGASGIQVSCFPGETFTLPNGAMPTNFCLSRGSSGRQKK